MRGIIFSCLFNDDQEPVQRHNGSDVPVKVLDIDFCEFKYDPQSSRLYFIVQRDNSPGFSVSGYFREPHMAAGSS